MNTNNFNNNRSPNRTRNNNQITPRGSRQVRNDFNQDDDYIQEERHTNTRQRGNTEQNSNYTQDDDNYPQRSPRRQNTQRQRSNAEYTNNRQQRDHYDDEGYYMGKRPAKSNKTLFVSLAAVAIVAIGAGVTFLTKNSNAQIIAVSPNYVTTQQAYQDCHRVGTTSYVANQKNGTEGALIGGATGAVAGGVIGNQVHGGGGGTAVGAIAGGVGGALIGREVQRSNQPDYVARRGSTTQCTTAYKPVQTQVGYSVQYMYKDEMNNIVTQMSPAIGSTMPLEELQAMAVPAAQLNPPVSGK